ncbi:MAG: methyltransferase domain-containing protein [Rhizobiales bacterium]|nr:methyltransferase domain-containing protein [Hyphomicrobiales bacterium]
MPPDRFAAILAQTNSHRARHGCGAYPFDDGSLLGVVAAAVRPKRILELGCALGYTANWMAYGAPDATVDTIDMDPEHVRLAQENAVKFGHGDRIRVHTGRFDDVLPTLTPGYDLAFFDGSSPTTRYLDAFHRLLSPRGALFSANLHFRDCETAAYRKALFEGGQWLSAHLCEDSETALSIRL